MSRLQKQRRDIDDILWRVTGGGAGQVKFINEDLGIEDDSVIIMSGRENATIQQTPTLSSIAHVDVSADQNITVDLKP